MLSCFISNYNIVIYNTNREKNQEKNYILTLNISLKTMINRWDTSSNLVSPISLLAMLHYQDTISLYPDRQLVIITWLLRAYIGIIYQMNSICDIYKFTWTEKLTIWCILKRHFTSTLEWARQARHPFRICSTNIEIISGKTEFSILPQERQYAIMISPLVIWNLKTNSGK